MIRILYRILITGDTSSRHFSRSFQKLMAIIHTGAACDQAEQSYQSLYGNRVGSYARGS
jgi:hypothetical protein